MRRLEQNNAELTHLRIAGSNLKTVYYVNGIFKTSVEGDFSTLGTFIGNNTCLEALEVVLLEPSRVTVLHNFMAYCHMEIFQWLHTHSILVTMISPFQMGPLYASKTYLVTSIPG